MHVNRTWRAAGIDVRVPGLPAEAGVDTADAVAAFLSSGCDPDVTHIRVNPRGVLAADAGSGAPGFELVFIAIVK